MKEARPREISKGPKPDSRAGTVGKMWRGTQSQSHPRGVIVW